MHLQAAREREGRRAGADGPSGVYIEVRPRRREFLQVIRGAVEK